MGCAGARPSVSTVWIGEIVSVWDMCEDSVYGSGSFDIAKLRVARK